jgi:hypothetical protein
MALALTIARDLVIPPSTVASDRSFIRKQELEVLVAHCAHVRTRFDNNLVENAVRPSAIGKKNFLFIGHPDAGQRSVIIYSIVGLPSGSGCGF